MGSLNYRYKFWFVGYISFDCGGNFKFIFGFKSGIDIKVNVVVLIIVNLFLWVFDFKWDGFVLVFVRIIIFRGDVIYKYLIRSFILVKDWNYFGNYILLYNGEIIIKIIINLEGSIYL